MDFTTRFMDREWTGVDVMMMRALYAGYRKSTAFHGIFAD